MMTVIEKQYMNAVISIDRQMKDKTPNWEQRRYEIAKDILSTMFYRPENHSLTVEADVDFAVSWNQGHSGGYDLDELFQWMNDIV